MGAKPDDDRYSEDEAQRRFETLVKAALNTPPQPLKDAPRKRGESKGKPRGPATGKGPTKPQGKA